MTTTRRTAAVLLLLMILLFTLAAWAGPPERRSRSGPPAAMAITFAQSAATSTTTEVLVPGPVYLQGQLTGSMVFYLEDSTTVQSVPVIIELKVLRGEYWKVEPRPAQPK